MQQFKLSNVLFHTSWQFHKAPTLYCAVDGEEAVLAPVKDSGDGSCELRGPGTFDFTTFFNSVSVFKWRRYANVEKFWLHIELKGAAATLVQTRADSYSYYPERIEGTETQLAGGDEWQALDIPLDVRGNETLHAFAIDAQGPVFIRNTWYYTEIDPGRIRPVELALCTTTFKKEAYIKRNVQVVKDRLLASGEPVVGHFHMHIVDNGRTLDASELESEHISIHPNPNAGGAGGFARGMIEAMEQEPRATHVLLMDDDVRISAESIIRSYQLLSIVNDEFAGAFLSGAMMNMDEPEVRTEDVGYVDACGKYFPLKPWERMSVLHDVVYNETFTVPESVSERPDMVEQCYAAWWYCVIPMTAIEAHGLPLPVFVRCDDVEYNLRCRPRLMTMNGICVWHEPFHMRYSAAVERYQMVRNVSLAQFTTGMASLSDFYIDFKRTFRLDIKKFDYDDAELTLEGFEDFLKGPGFIATPGQAEKSYLAALKKQEKFQSFEEARDELLELGIDLDEITACDILKLSGEMAAGRLERVKRRVVKEQLTGQRFAGGKYYDDKDPIVIDGKGFYDPGAKIDHHDTIVAVDIERRRVAIRRMDRERFNELWKRYKEDLKAYRDNKERLKTEYAAAREKLTSVAFWKHYLGMDED